jgi:hypothetical protein
MCKGCGDTKRIGYVCHCSMATTNEHPETKEDIVQQAFDDWWEEESQDPFLNEPDAIAERAWKAALSWRALK